MAKKKVASSKEEEAAVLEYMTKANRPYSATDIFNNLHQKYTKGSITKALEKLVQDESVISKSYGKTTIYSIKQKVAAITTAEGEAGEKRFSSSSQNLDTISKNLDELAVKYEELLSGNKKLEQTLNSIKSEPTTAETRELLEKVQKENEMLQERLNKLKDGTVLIPPEKRKRTNEEYTTNRNLWKKRKGIFNNIFKTVTEHLPGDPKKLKEQLGIEEDDVPFDQDPLAALSSSSAKI